MLKRNFNSRLIWLDKKGLTASFIVGMMITLIAFFLIAGMLYKFASKAEGVEAEIMCHDSVALRARTALYMKSEAVSGELKMVPPLCKTLDVKIKGNKQELMRQISDKTARCWWMFNEGRYEEILDTFGLKLLPNILGFGASENKCFNCYTLLVDQDEIEGGTISSKELADFMASKKYAKVNLTYIDYIQSYGGPGRVVITVPEIKPRSAYTISMMPKNKIEGVTWIEVLKYGLAIGYAPVTGGGSILAVASFDSLSQEKMYQEADVSSIYLGTLQTGQEMCISDIAGE